MSEIIKHSNDRVAVIIDGMGTGRYLAPAFISLGFSCIHIENQTEKHPQTSLYYNPELYKENLSFSGNMEGLVEQLGKYKVFSVLAGGESGVQLAVKLSQALAVPVASDRLEESVFRDKKMLYEALDYPGNRFFLREFTNAENLISTCSALEKDFPLVIKPRAGVLALGVTICNHSSDLASAAEKAFRLNDPFGRGESPSVIAMSKIVGSEYMVNSISSQGKHVVREIWHVRKKEIMGSPAYYTGDYIPAESPVFSVIEQEVLASLEKLGVLNGPCHIEVIVNHQNQPVIIDFGFRLQGMMDPTFPLAIYGSSTVLDTVLSSAHQGWFDTLRKPTNAKFARTVTIHAPNPGVITHEIHWNLFSVIPQLHGIRKGCQQGDRIAMTENGMNSFATLYLVAESYDEIESATQAIHEIERNSKFYSCITS